MVIVPGCLASFQGGPGLGGAGSGPLTPSWQEGPESSEQPSAPLQPCFLKDWEMHVHFKVHGAGKKNLHGDGIALWYTRDRLVHGRAVLRVLWLRVLCSSPSR